MFFCRFQSTPLIKGVAFIWVLTNCVFTSNSFSPDVHAAVPCNLDTITNDSDCSSTSNNARCHSECNSGCTVTVDKVYLDSSHDQQVTGGSSAYDKTTFVPCWNEATCSATPLTGWKCVTGPTGTKYCDGNHTFFVCQECEPGTHSAKNIENAIIKACPE